MFTVEIYTNVLHLLLGYIDNAIKYNDSSSHPQHKESGIQHIACSTAYLHNHYHTKTLTLRAYVMVFTGKDTHRGLLSLVGLWTKYFGCVYNICSGRDDNARRWHSRGTFPS